MTAHAKISVVIPAFNAAASLLAAVESCLNQTVPPFEILVIDDASTDETATIARTLADRFPSGTRVTVLRNDRNLGPSATRNGGWDRAEGDYVAFLDADDRWHPRKLFRVTEVLAASPNIALLAHSNGPASIIGVEKLPLMKLLVSNFACTANMVVKREISERFDEAMRFTEDHDLWLRIAQKHGAYVFDGADIATTLGRKPLSRGGLSGNRYRMRAGEVYMYAKFVSRGGRNLFYTPMVAVIILAKMVKEGVRGFRSLVQPRMSSVAGRDRQMQSKERSREDGRDN